VKLPFKIYLPCLLFKSAIADLIASSAKTEQCILTGGSANSSAIAEFLISDAWSNVLPLSHSVTSELEAIAEPHP
jgi:hypothetical protein